MPVSSLAVGRAEVAKLDFTQPEVDRLKAKLLALTEATVTVRTGRDEHGHITYGEVPNVGIQLAATVKALEFGVGKARQMIEVTETPGGRKTPPGLADLGRLLSQNPEMMARVISALKDGIAISQAIDVSATSQHSPALLTESQSGSSPSQSV